MVLGMEMEVFLIWCRQKHSQNWRLTFPQTEVFACPQAVKKSKTEIHQSVAATATNICNFSCFFRFLISFLRTRLMMICFLAVFCNLLIHWKRPLFFRFNLSILNKKWVCLTFMSSFSILICRSNIVYSCIFYFNLLFLLSSLDTIGFKDLLEEISQ